MVLWSLLWHMPTCTTTESVDGRAGSPVQERWSDWCDWCTWCMDHVYRVDQPLFPAEPRAPALPGLCRGRNQLARPPLGSAGELLQIDASNREGTTDIRDDLFVELCAVGHIRKRVDGEVKA